MLTCRKRTPWPRKGRCKVLVHRLSAAKPGTPKPGFSDSEMLCCAECSMSKITNQKWTGGLKGGDSRPLTFGHRLSRSGRFIFRGNKQKASFSVPKAHPRVEVPKQSGVCDLLPPAPQLYPRPAWGKTTPCPVLPANCAARSPRWASGARGARGARGGRGGRGGGEKAPANAGCWSWRRGALRQIFFLPSLLQSGCG